MLYVLFKEKGKPQIRDRHSSETHSDRVTDGAETDKGTTSQDSFRQAQIQSYNRQFGLSLG